MFVLGGAQGVLGWYMVRSGLVDEPRVSQYRLAAHLSLAVVIYVYLLALALQVLDAHGSKRRMAAGVGFVHRLALAAGGLGDSSPLVIGAFVAGLKAGHVYPTFPMMGEFWVPPGMFEDRAVVEELLRKTRSPRSSRIECWLSRAVSSSSRPGARVFEPTCPRRVRLWAHASLVAVVVQVALGVSTLLLHVPVPLAAGHQGGRDLPC